MGVEEKAVIHSNTDFCIILKTLRVTRQLVEVKESWIWKKKKNRKKKEWHKSQTIFRDWL